MSPPINVGDTINVRFHPGAVPTTAVVQSIDPVRGRVVVQHTSGHLFSRIGTIALAHCKKQNDIQGPFCDGKLWQ